VLNLLDTPLSGERVISSLKDFIHGDGLTVLVGLSNVIGDEAPLRLLDLTHHPSSTSIFLNKSTTNS